jgi:16S rRNA (guanine966-N2)-methyltransferase
MNVRIIAGEYGGRVLDAPSGERTHPMGERIRGALFNSLGTKVKNARVLDVFAGTGSIGLEALSRGAKAAWFVERDPLAFKIMSANITLVGAGDRAETSKAALGAWVKTYRSEPFSLIFADPPYNRPQDELVEKLFKFLTPNGLLILSHATRHKPILLKSERVDSRVYGDATLSFFKKLA